MERKTLDKLLAGAGVLLTAVLLVAGALLGWAHTYVHGQVHDELAAQKIFFPAAGSKALASPEIGPYLNKYAGEQLTTGAQAHAWANHFIAVHLTESTGGQTYAQLSTKAQADPTNTQLAGQVATAFKGETLRGLLLNAYAFDTMGNLAFIGSIVAYAGAALMALLAGLGFWHSRRAGTKPQPAFPAQEMITA